MLEKQSFFLEPLLWPWTELRTLGLNAYRQDLSVSPWIKANSMKKKQFVCIFYKHRAALQWDNLHPLTPEEYVLKQCPG